jgi:hypothetical protein
MKRTNQGKASAAREKKSLTVDQLAGLMEDIRLIVEEYRHRPLKRKCRKREQVERIH